MSVCHKLEHIQVQVFTKARDFQAYLRSHKQEGHSIGFVPTMGALHAGHGSLISRARKENDLVVASIFVNPTQFNNSSDLEKYPRTVEADSELLAALGCDAVLVPSVDEIYVEGFELPEIELGYLDMVMEGFYRPGHFQGVVQVVYRLFQIVEPDRAYFGLKDYQQIAVVRYMTRFFDLPVEIIACPTLRENDGLAMSSRNLRLSSEEREMALHVSRTLYKAKELSKTHIPSETKSLAEDFFSTSPMKLEYLEIVHPDTLHPLTTDWVPGAIACIVAYAGDIRLIDNMEMEG